MQLRSLGHRVVIVSSGAIGMGLHRMGLPAGKRPMGEKQALAAVGQGRLIALWDQLFGMLGQSVAQVLLTRNDIADVSHSETPDRSPRVLSSLTTAGHPRSAPATSTPLRHSRRY